MTKPEFAYGGARALVGLHEKHLRTFVARWWEADRRDLTLPVADDPDYASREALLSHVLICAAGYLVWICRHASLPRPDVGSKPEADGLTARAETHLETILDAWRTALVDLTPDQAYEPAFPAPWGPPYCLDAMLEHAVMHPLRHAHQLERWLAAAAP